MKALIRAPQPFAARRAIAQLFKNRHEKGVIVFDWWALAPVNGQGLPLLEISARPIPEQQARDLAASFGGAQGRFVVMGWRDFCRGAISKLAGSARGYNVKRGIK